MKEVLVLGAVVLLCSASVGWSDGEQPMPPMATQTTQEPFHRGTKEFQNVAGAFFFVDRGGTDRPSVDLAVDSLRLGFMLNDPKGSGILAGNFEFLGEIFAGPIVHGPGSVTTGATLFIRYNFVQPRARLIPYAQIGAGGVYTDIGEKESGGLISLPVEFNLQVGLGTRLMLNDRWSVVLEAGYRHISNAEIKKPNFGINSIGGSLGLGFLF